MDDFEPLTIDSPFPGASAWRRPLTASTMEDARALSARSRYGLVLADVQTAGRGRLPGRSWDSERGASLLATLWFPRDAFGHAPLPLVAGVALLKACESWAAERGVAFRHAPLIKWPNDITAGGKKLAGILCEAAGDSVFVGIGLNRSQQAFFGDFRTEPTSLFLETGERPAGLEPLEPFLAELARLGDGSVDWHTELNLALAGVGGAVSFKTGLGDGKPLLGTLVDVDLAGFVRILTANGLQAFNSGELRLVYD